MAKARANPHAGPVIILAGGDRFLQLEHTRGIRESLRQAHGEVDSILFDGATAKPADILDECRSMGLMVRHKVVVVDDADLLLKVKAEGEPDGEAPAGGARTARELFESYAASPEPSATLVLRASVWRKGKLDGAVTASGGSIIACEAPNDAGTAAWAVERARSAHEARLANDAAVALVRLLGTDLGRIDSELGKLALWLRARGEQTPSITAAMVSEHVGESREDEVWTLQQGLLSGDPAAAMGNLRSALEVARHSPVLVGIAYVDLCRKLDGLARGLAAGEHERSLLGRLKVWNGADRLVHAARALRPAGTARLLKAAVEADQKQKSGQGEPVRILEGLTLMLSGALSR